MRELLKATGLILGLTGGCAAGVDEVPVAAVADELVGGMRTQSVPAVGYISVSMPMDCTATLVQRRVILAAAHCFSWQSRSDPGASGTFVFDGGRQQRTILRYTSLTTDRGDAMNDIAVAELDSDVLADNVVTQPFAIDPPSDPASDVRVLGFGCDNPVPTPAGSFVCPEDAVHEKNIVSFPAGWLNGFMLSSNVTGQTSTLTNYDSGGPLYNSNWQIFGVSSRTDVLRDTNGNWVETRDYFANTAWNRTRILDAIAAFNN